MFLLLPRYPFFYAELPTEERYSLASETCVCSYYYYQTAGETGGRKSDMSKILRYTVHGKKSSPRESYGFPWERG
jgi:hypothetical protein